ncbi:MAG: HEAT repeat domain-containing protein [Abitibacteriaceae bacterium]|nr:HEAT repeat domain-containing protein [Abditibacteriaceae bacterium]
MVKLTQKKKQAQESLQRDIGQVAQEHGLASLPGSELVELLAKREGLLEWAAIDTLLKRGSASVPALIAGLSHHKGKIRSTCALLLDHVADDRCVEPLINAIRHDPLEAVRRCALHSLICDGCKECPLTTDVIAILTEVAERDRSLAVRRRAVFYLSQQRPNARVAPFLQNLVETETDTVLLRRAANALQHHQPIVGGTSFVACP